MISNRKVRQYSSCASFIFAFFVFMMVMFNLIQMEQFQSYQNVNRRIKPGRIKIEHEEEELKAEEMKESTEEMGEWLIDTVFEAVDDDILMDLYELETSEQNVEDTMKWKNKEHPQESSSSSLNIPHNSTHNMLRSYEYSNCPFIMTKFSQHRMAESGPFSSEKDYMIRSNHRAELALNFSNDLLAYHRVKSALEHGAFDNRKIVMDGDSLQRQNFISLACLAWEAGFVQSYRQHVNVVPSSDIPTLRNSSYSDKSTKLFTNGFVSLNGGGEIHYYDKSETYRIEEQTREMATHACDDSVASDSKEVKSQLSVHVSPLVVYGGKLRMTKNDVLVLSPGHHNDVRNIYLREYRKTLTCIEDAEKKERKTFNRWPHIMLSTSSVSSFWTESGQYSSRPLANSDKKSCRVKVPGAEDVLRTQERNILGRKVASIGGGLKLENLGDLHVWHGDCLHWIQPGIPDVYAADLANYLLATM